MIYPLSMYFFPKKAIEVFYTRECGEDQIIYPLILAGKKVIPYLISEIRDPKMKQRRYAIDALGQIGDECVIPFLEKILKDEKEIYYFRYNALNSIAMIDFEYAKKLAKELYDKKIKLVSDLSKELLTNEENVRNNFVRKTFWDALFDRHD
jgi:HEAT repeat protein